MTKKKKGDGEVIPLHPVERYTWKCKVRGCGVKGKAATKEDARTALTLHMTGAH